jgi:peptidoglycan hydrolase-like protein with peptidoglycan-binding domain
MVQKVNPGQVEGLAVDMGRLNRTIEEKVTKSCNDVKRMVSDTRSSYSENYVQSAANNVDSLINEIRQLSKLINEQLHKKEKTLRWVAGEYILREKESTKKADSLPQKLPLFSNQFSGANYFGKKQSSYPFNLFSAFNRVSVTLPIHVKPLSRDLSLDPNNHSAEVMMLQNRLRALGYPIEANGYFNAETLEAVNTFKDRYGLGNEGPETGVVGEQTWRYLFGSINGTLTLTTEESSDSIKLVQYRLKELGFDIEATGKFDEATLRALNGFKEIHGTGAEESGNVIGQKTWRALFNMLPPPTSELKPLDPRSFTHEDVLNRDDPEVAKRLEKTYWANMTPAEQDEFYNKIKKEDDRLNKEWEDKMRQARTGIGNPFFAKLFEGGSNILVNTIDTASAGVSHVIADSIVGPMPEGYVDPMDNPYGKKAGQFIGNVVGFFLPFKYLKAIKTPAALSKLSPTLVRSVTSGAIFGTATEISDSITDFKKDGDQTLGERATGVAIDTALAGAGDIVVHSAFRLISGFMKDPVKQKFKDFFRGKLDEGKGVYDLLKKSRCNIDELTAYLKKMDEYSGTKNADEFASSGKWPNEIQIPKDPSVLNADGSIKWSEVPNGGYVLDEVGNAIKEKYVPKAGEVIDRYGPSNGRYTSPVIEGKPYSYDQRSLPYIEAPSMYHQYKINDKYKDIQSYIDNCPDLELKADVEAYINRYSVKLDIYKGEIAPGFGATGGGIQYQFPLPVDMLEDLGYLKLIK